MGPSTVLYTTLPVYIGSLFLLRNSIFKKKEGKICTKHSSWLFYLCFKRRYPYLVFELSGPLIWPTEYCILTFTFFSMFTSDAFYWIKLVLYEKQKMLKSGHFIDSSFQWIKVVVSDLFKQSTLIQRFIESRCHRVDEVLPLLDRASQVTQQYLNAVMDLERALILNRYILRAL